jgi:hypothetical protein
MLFYVSIKFGENRIWHLSGWNEHVKSMTVFFPGSDLSQTMLLAFLMNRGTMLC